MFPNEKNLWGELPKNVEELRTPYVILKEQASILTQMTKGLLIGEVKRISFDQKSFLVRLRIKVPSLNSYTYSVVEVQYSPEIYPLTIIDLTGSEKQSECSSQQEFEADLSRILSSDPVKRAISTLLAEIQSGDELQENPF